MKKTLAQEMIDGLDELAESLEKGANVRKVFNVRDVALHIEPTRYTPALVKKTRLMLNASQVFFAGFLGVAPNTLRAWEQGVQQPPGIAARFLDEIRDNPDYWKARIMRSVSLKANPPKRKASSRRKPRKARRA